MCYDAFKGGIPIKPLKVKVSITLTEPIVERIRILAEEDNRSVSQYIDLVLKKHLASLDNSENN